MTQSQATHESWQEKKTYTAEPLAADHVSWRGPHIPGSLTLAEQRAWWNRAAIDNAEVAVLTDRKTWDREEFYRSGDDWVNKHRAFAMQSLIDLRGEKALDFGCGLGRMTLAWRKHYESVTGVDISPEMVSRATERVVREGVSFQVVDGYPLPFDSGTFDLVYSTIVVQHISAPHNLEYVTEFFRLARPGGYVMFDAPHKELPGEDQGGGIFLLPFRLVMERAAAAGCELLMLRDFQATRTRHYQYVFRRL